MNRIFLTRGEVEEIQSLVSSVSREYSSAEDAMLLRNAVVYAHDLPRRVRVFLNDFKMQEPYEGMCLISGYPIDNAKIGKTPNHWKTRQQVSPTLDEEILLILLGSLLGDALGWATQQDGHIIHDIFPIKGNEDEQLGTGSEQMLAWHNEDAFHSFRGDYLGMMCLRNPASVATNVAPAAIRGLSPEQIAVLFESRFIIRPDNSHTEKNRSDVVKETKGKDQIVESAYKKIGQMNTHPEKVAVLFGDPGAPYIRIDPYFMDILENDPEAQSALDALIRSINSILLDIVLEPGDFVFIDNFKAVHGRRPFRARYDGNDRWLKRINLARDLRKSRDFRLSCESRILY